MSISFVSDCFFSSFGSLSAMEFEQIQANLSQLTDKKSEKGLFSERQILLAVIRVVSDPQDLDDTDLKILESQTLVSDFAHIVCKLKKESTDCLLSRFARKFTSPQIKPVDLKVSLIAACQHVRSPLIAYFDPSLSVSEVLCLRAEEINRLNVLHERPDFACSPKVMALRIEAYQNSVCKLIPNLSDQDVLRDYVRRTHRIVKELGLPWVAKASPSKVRKWVEASFKAIQNEFSLRLCTIESRAAQTLNAGLKTAIALNPKFSKDDEISDDFMIVNPGPWAELEDSSDELEELDIKESAFLAYSELRLKHGAKYEENEHFTKV